MEVEQRRISSSLTSQFSPYHHEKTQVAYQRSMCQWKDKIDRGIRCGACWLRPHDCCCLSYFQERREVYRQKGFYNDDPQATNEGIGVKFLVYYHFREIGRSANTAHLMENIIPCERIIFGDSEKEIALAKEISQEHLSGARRTVILYPCATSLGINQWMNENSLSSSDIQTDRENNSHKQEQSRNLRLILLDGTYSDADKLARHLERLLRMYNCPNPLVKLDLESGKCTSAVTGIMYQPNPEKICTFQAATMAAQQVISHVKSHEQEKSHEFCTMLSEDLNYWLNHLLVSKIKLGKVKPKQANKAVDHTPSKLVQDFLKSSPPPVGTGLKIKKGNIASLYIAGSYDHVLDADGNITLLGKSVDKDGVVYRTAEEKRKWQLENYRKHTCKFWRVDGNCRFGDKCKYRHDFDNETETVETLGSTGLVFMQSTEKFRVFSLVSNE